MKQAVSFKSRVALLLGVSIVGVLVLSVVAMLQAREQALDARRTQLKWAVQTALNTAAGLHQKVKDGKLSDEQAQAQAKEAIRVARYGGSDGKSEYFYIWSLDGVNVMHPIKPEWEGKQRADAVKAPNGQAIVVDMLNTLKASADGQAYVSTLWPRPGEKVDIEKLQYVTRFEPWGWMVGSGLYMDDVNASVRAEVMKVMAWAFGLLLPMVAMGVMLVRSVMREIGGEPYMAAQVMSRVAQGDLTVRLPGMPRGSLLAALDSMIQSLSGVVSQTKSAASNIAVGSSQIATGNQDLSTRTENTAAQLQMTAASMHKLAEAVAASTVHAEKASAVAAEARHVAAAGGQEVRDAVGHMQEISEASSRISEITAVIDGIAFQTNILALNAAVEAARAGEQGKGFAVVASEVRTLAQRSAQAAKEIKTLITDATTKVATGTATVSKAGESMVKIVESVEAMNSIMGEILHSAREQGRDIQAVNGSVAEVDGMTQQNSALVEEAAAAASSLRDQATRLSSVIEEFRCVEQV